MRFCLMKGSATIMKKISDVLNRVCETTLILFLAAMAIIVLLQVIFRYLLHLPLFWTEECARYCLVWASLLGAAIALKRGEHIALTFFLERFPLRVSRGLTQIARFSVVAILAIMLWGGVKLVLVTSLQTSPALRIPMAVPYLALPISSGIMLIHVITAIVCRGDEVAQG
jgi:TRAP-type C4-dicarboxylate transport system permease small subunit